MKTLTVNFLEIFLYQLLWFFLFYDYSIKYCVLVVDDNCEDRESLRELLMSIKSQTTPTMDVQVAKNGKEAVYLHLAGASFDMIVMDDLMPVMNGIEVCQRDCREFFLSFLFSFYYIRKKLIQDYKFARRPA